MSFPNTPPAAFDLNHKTKQSGEVPPAFRSRSDPHFGTQHPPPNGPEGSYMDQLKGEWSGGVVQQGSGDRFPFQNGVITFRQEGHQVLSDLAIHQQGKVKRMRTASQR